jgi:hypothetical protein
LRILGNNDKVDLNKVEDWLDFIKKEYTKSMKKAIVNCSLTIGDGIFVRKRR